MGERVSESRRRHLAVGDDVSELEQRVITAATAYASANGYAVTDRTAVGLVLVGMVIAASCPPPVQAEIRRNYLSQHEDARDLIEGWAEFLSVTPDPDAWIDEEVRAHRREKAARIREES